MEPDSPNSADIDAAFEAAQEAIRGPGLRRAYGQQRHVQVEEDEDEDEQEEPEPEPDPMDDDEDAQPIPSEFEDDDEPGAVEDGGDFDAPPQLRAQPSGRRAAAAAEFGPDATNRPARAISIPEALAQEQARRRSAAPEIGIAPA